MSFDFDPVRLRDCSDGPEGRAGRRIARVRVTGDWPLERRTAAFWAIRAKAEPSGLRRRNWRVAAATVACAVGAAWFLVSGPSAMRSTTASWQPDGRDLARSGWKRVDLAEVGTLELSPDAEFDLRELPAERQLRLGQGTLRAEMLRQDPLRPVVVVARDLRVIVVGTRFDVEGGSAPTRVRVLHGQVRVETPWAALLVSGGESVASDDPRLTAPNGEAVPASTAPSAAPTPGTAAEHRAPRRDGMRAPDGEDCARLGVAQQKRCFLRRLGGNGLGAQNALVALGLYARDVEDDAERALDYFRAYERRFPNGALAPEAALGILETLKEQGRAAEAVEAAVAFEHRFPGEPRAAEVALVLGELLCAEEDRRDEGLAVLDSLSRTGPPGLRSRVLRARERCGPEPVVTPESEPQLVPDLLDRGLGGESSGTGARRQFEGPGASRER